MPAVRIGVQVQPQHCELKTLLEATRAVEELGVDSIYTWDHFYPLFGEPDGEHWEGMTTLTAMATVTERAQIGMLVFCNSYRNPQLLADAHRTLDHLSGGRVILGIGAGWFERDYDEYGYEFGTAPERLKALRRDLPLMKARLAKLNPPPTREIPFLIGGSGEKVTLRLVAEHAQMWHGFADLETYRHKTSVLAEHCEKVGRDPAEIDHVIGIQGDDQATVAPALADAGVAELTIGLSAKDGRFDMGQVKELLSWRDSHRAS